jgi:DNA-binding XRE family transcriptional regulator
MYARIDGSPIREARERLGLTQAELAARAGVSRQLVVACESGRHAPSVDAAVRLARCLGATVEDLFAPGVEAPLPIVGELRDGDLVVAGRVGDRLVAHALDARSAADGGWSVADGQLDGGLRLFPGGHGDGFVAVGCDPALGVAATMLAGRGAMRLVAVPASTGRAVDALAAGRCHAVLVHGPATRLPADPCPVRRWHLARWRVGVALAGAPPAPALEAVLDGRVALVQREPSASSQQGLERAAARAGAPLPSALAVASGHLDAARTALAIGGAGVTFEPAAVAFGLPFIPLEEHVVELWVAASGLEHPALRALGELVSSAAFQRRLGAIGGYDLTDCGTTREAA